MAHKYDLDTVFDRLIPYVIKHMDLIMAEDIWEDLVANKDIMKKIVSRQYDDNYKLKKINDRYAMENTEYRKCRSELNKIIQDASDILNKRADEIECARCSKIAAVFKCGICKTSPKTLLRNANV